MGGLPPLPGYATALSADQVSQIPSMPAATPQGVPHRPARLA